MAFASIAAMLILALFWPGKTVLSLEGESGFIYSQYELGEGETFSVSFIHSVNKSAVEEGYSIRNGSIYLDTCLYSAFGAGVATEIEQGQTLSYTSDGKMLISNINRKMENLSYIVATVSDHILVIDGSETSLGELCGKNSTVRFKVLKKSFISCLFL
ncbi:MAG: DUF1850 domain-containing protein [Firmicutes bacterium]|nr:DUF1850 domain-containing protein [Bacillota bacterium]